ATTCCLSQVSAARSTHQPERGPGPQYLINPASFSTRKCCDTVDGAKEACRVKSTQQLSSPPAESVCRISKRTGWLIALSIPAMRSVSSPKKGTVSIASSPYDSYRLGGQTLLIALEQFTNRLPTSSARRF